MIWPRNADAAICALMSTPPSARCPLAWPPAKARYQGIAEISGRGNVASQVGHGDHIGNRGAFFQKVPASGQSYIYNSIRESEGSRSLEKYVGRQCRDR